MKGIILAGGSGTRLYPITRAVSKQLLPVYDKPMIYYPLSTLMLAGIREILVITTYEDQLPFMRLLLDGRDFGVKITYGVQEKPQGLAQAFTIASDCGFLKDGEPCALILGDNIFHTSGFSEMLDTAVGWASYDGPKGPADLPRMATVFGIKVKDPQRYGIAEVDEDGTVLSIEEKPKEPKSDICVTGLYFYPGDVVEKARQVKPSERGELEITSLNQLYLQDGRLRLTQLPRGAVWLDTGTFDSLYDASSFVETIEKRSGTMIACPEEIAFNNGWISKEKLWNSAVEHEKNEYGRYLKEIYFKN